MKKVFAIAILLTVAVLAVSPAAAFAETSGTAATANLRLVNPVAIASVGDKLFVADNIDQDNNQSVVLCFDVSTSVPQYLFTHSTSKRITNISEVDGKLCIIHPDCVELYAVEQNSLGSENQSQIGNTPDVVDVTFGTITFGTMQQNTEYYVGGSEQKLFYSDGTQFNPVVSTPEAIACLEFETYIYFLYGGGICKRFDTSRPTFTESDSFNQNVSFVSGFKPTGIFSCTAENENRLVVHDKTSLYYLVQTSSVNYAFDQPLFQYNSENRTIVDVCSNGSKVFVLNSANEVEIYSQDADGFHREETTIGTDTITVGETLPSGFDGFTLAKSTGYPTNIVYKTTDETTTVAEILTDYTNQFIILHFDGAEELPFYYVLVGNKFGWVKKSDGATSAENDSKVAIIDTVPQDVTYKAKFISANSVSIYELPLSDSNHETFNQTLNNARDVEILQKFTEVAADESVVEWYYVSYGEGKKGFIQSGNVGQFYAASSIEAGIPYLDDMKINSSLFEAVKIYLTSDMLENEAICDEQGNLVKLYSGATVKALRNEKDATYIEVEHNGKLCYGWIPSDNLIGRHRVTTNAAVGLCILAAATVCALVFVFLFLKRKNKKHNSNEE